MGKKDIKVYVQGRYRTLLNDLSKLDEEDLSIQSRERKRFGIKQRMGEVQNIASNFGIRIQELD